MFGDVSAALEVVTVLRVVGVFDAVVDRTDVVSFVDPVMDGVAVGGSLVVSVVATFVFEAVPPMV